jgi:hypothetical protein
MINVTMWLRSAIHESRDTALVTITITNDGTGTVARGHYDYLIYGRGRQRLKAGRIENWPRQSKSACALLQRVINHAYPTGA